MAITTRTGAGIRATENTTMQQAQLGIFFAAIIALVVCGRVLLTRRPIKGTCSVSERAIE